MAANGAIPVAPAEVFAAAQQALAVSDIPAFDAYVDRLLRIAPDWYEALLMAAASFEARDPARAERLYLLALRNTPGASEAAAGAVRAGLALGKEVRLDLLGVMGAFPPERGAISTARMIAARYGWPVVGFVIQRGGEIFATSLMPTVDSIGFAFRLVEDSEATTLRGLVSESPAAPDIARIAERVSDQNGLPTLRMPAPGAGKYLVIATDAEGRPVGCMLPVLSVRPYDAVRGEVWWTHEGVVSGWAEARHDGAPCVEIISDPPAPTQACTIAPLAYAGEQPATGKALYGFCAVLPRDAARRTLDVRIDGKSLSGAPIRVEGGGALTSPLRSFVLEAPDWHLLPKIERVFEDVGARDAVIDVVVPVYRNVAKTKRCLESVLRAVSKVPYHLVTVNDESPSPGLTRYLRQLAVHSHVTLIENVKNLGFSGAVNMGMRLHPARDVVLLNADTEVADGWLDRLNAAALTKADVGTVTPLSNNATILSYPAAHTNSPFLSGQELAAMDRVFADERVGPVEIPTAVGFCMYIRRACLEDCGDFDEVNFGKGYGEENEFCLRAAARGWRHVCAPDVYVAHDGGVSFDGQHAEVARRRLRTLQQTFPGYERFIQRFVHNDPLRAIRRAADERRLLNDARPTVVMVTSDLGGGTGRHVEDLCGALETEGFRCLVLSADRQMGPSPQLVRLQVWRRAERAPDAPGVSVATFPNLTYQLSDEAEGLSALLHRLNIVRVHIQHFLGLPWDVLELITRLKAAFDVTVHDYSWICGRVTMVGPSQRYCGEPDLEGCGSCIAAAGDRTQSGLDVGALRKRSADLFTRANQVYVPSQDVAARLRRHIPGLGVTIRPHPYPGGVSQTSGSVSGLTREDIVAVIGAINADKGYDVLLACARDAAQRGLALRFAVIGFTQDDGPLLQTGRVSITGRYQEHEVVELIAATHAPIGWVPSICPETWSYALSQILSAGLLPVAFDLGTPAERLRALSYGTLLALELGPEAINDALVQLLKRGSAPHAIRDDGGRYPSVATDYYVPPLGQGDTARFAAAAHARQARPRARTEPRSPRPPINSSRVPLQA